MTESTVSTKGLDDFATQLRTTHDALTTEFLGLQMLAEDAWAKYELARATLQDFRKRYGHVLRAFDEADKQGAITVEVPVDAQPEALAEQE